MKKEKEGAVKCGFYSDNNWINFTPAAVRDPK